MIKCNAYILNKKYCNNFVKMKYFVEVIEFTL